MSNSWRYGRQMNANSEDRQLKVEVPVRDSGVGNGTLTFRF
jgi:hypothetical protein